MTGSEHVDLVEQAKVALDLEYRLGRILEDSRMCAAMAREQFGRVQHGASINEPLADLHRELDEVERAVSNTRNALAVLRGQDRPAHPGPLEVLERPSRTVRR